ncbi:MAG: hypothetical protein ACYC1D_10960 [Acidimicrobiales bacterium]
MPIPPSVAPFAPLPAEVRDRVAAYAAEMDRSAPEALEGLYLVGSVALGDFRPRFSNIDAVAVSSEWSDPAVAGSRRAGGHLDRPHRRAVLVHLTWEALGEPPSGEGLDNAFTRMLLRDDAVVERGPDYPDIWADEAALRAWGRVALHDRWRPWLDIARRRPGSLLLRQGVAARVLAACQLHAATGGRVQSKTAAGRMAQGDLGPNPNHGRILRDATGYREGSRTSMYWGAVERRRHALALIEEIVRRAATS